MKVLQLCPPAGDFHAVYWNDACKDDDDEQIYYVPIAALGVVETRRGETTAGPMILLRDGSLVLASEVDDLIAVTPTSSDDDEAFIAEWKGKQSEKGRKGRKAASKPAKSSPRPEPVRVPDEAEEEEAEEEEEEEEDDPPEGEVQFSGRKR